VLRKHLERSTRPSFKDQRLLQEVVGDYLPDTMELMRIILQNLIGEWPVFIIMDEFDAALIEIIKVQGLLYDLRKLYDDTVSGLCFVIGLKGEPSAR